MKCRKGFQKLKIEVDAVILKRFSELKKEGQLGISHGDRHEENTNSVDGSRSQKRYKLDRDDTKKSGRLLDTPERRASTCRFYSTSASRRHHHHHS